MTETETTRLLLRQWHDEDLGPWAAIDRLTGRWLGQIGLNELPRWPGPDKIEVGWDLHPSVWGRGWRPRAPWLPGTPLIGPTGSFCSHRIDGKLLTTCRSSWPC